MRYSVELRTHSEDGDDYSEDHYDFDTREDAIQFASKYRGKVHSVLEYDFLSDKDYNPTDITWEI